MRHLIKSRKFGRTADYRKLFLWNLGNSLLLKGRIKTTEARAKEIKPLIERVISRAKKDTLANRRLLLKNLKPKTVDKVFKELAVRYAERPGGYLRILKLGSRKNDAAEMAIIEFIK